MTLKAPVRHECNYQGWSFCCICDGRFHLPGCTSRKRPAIDCCPARHKALHDKGITRGIADSSQAMWSPTEPYGFHDPKGDK